MKLYTQDWEKWPSPLEIYWMLPGQSRLRQYGGNSVLQIASASQAYALQRMVLKRYEKFFAYQELKKGPDWRYRRGRELISNLQHIEPGAMYWLGKVTIGTRKISRPFPDWKNSIITAEQIASTPGIVGAVVIDDRFAHYYIKATASRLYVIPKDRCKAEDIR